MKLFKLIPVFFVALIYGQNDVKNNTLVVAYYHTTHIEGMPNKTRVEATLLDNSVHSMYEMDYLGHSNFVDQEDSKDGIVLNIKPTNNPKIYKEINTQSIYSAERIFMTPFIVKDGFDIFKWQLTNDFKEILGYQCQKAKMNYRGRDYTAYFTTEIPFKNGPWKFSGLPGLILEVKSADNVFVIEAFKIKVSNVDSKILYPFKTNQNEAIPWETFIEKYKKKQIELLSYTDEQGGSVSIPNRKIEVLIED